MNLSSIHLIRNEQLQIAYQTSTMDMYVLNEATYRVLQQVQETGCLPADGLPPEVSGLLQAESAPEESLRPVRQGHPANDRPVERITLHVSNDCNLRCKYCYADGGHYQTRRGIMTMETARQFVDFCQNHLGRIQSIVFFGGEPMLNIPVMDYVCDRFKALHQNGEISYLPSFGIITNGTILNEQVVHFVQKHLAFVTVSIDGLQEANDANRIFKDGRGSYDHISRFIHTLKKRTSVNIGYEATFTRQHIEQGCTPNNIAGDLKREFGIEGSVIEEMNLQTGNKENYWQRFDYEKCKRQECHLPEGFWSILEAIRFKRPKDMCNVAYSVFSVATNGDLYPCHINTDVSKTCLGNITGKNIFNEPALRKKLFPTPVKQNTACKDCWANTICGGCARAWFYDEQEETYRKLPHASLCRENRKHLENVLLLIAAIRKDKEFWEQIVQNKKIEGSQL